MSDQFGGSIQADALDREELIDAAEQSESISTPDFETFSSIELEGPDPSAVDNDESFWFDDKSADDTNLWTSTDAESLFKAMCDNANPVANPSFESVENFSRNIRFIQ